MNEEIIYNQLPKLPSTLSNPDTCKICKGALKEKICKVYLYDIFMSKVRVANIKALFCEECNMPYCTRHHEAYVKKRWPELTLRAIPILGNAKAEKTLEHCKNILFYEPKIHTDAPLLEDGAYIYVGTHNSFPTLCTGKKEDVVPAYVIMVNSQGDQEKHLLSRCKKCGKIFMKTHIYKSWSSYYPKYNYVLPESLIKEEVHKKEILSVESKLNKESQKSIVEEYKIAPKQFLTRVHVFRCTNKNHKLLDVIATVKVLNAVGVLKEVSVPAAYCKTCNKYYILEKEYQRLKGYGHIVCKVVENTYWTKGLKDNPFNLNEESVLHLLGYNVNAQAGLSQSQRWGLLEIMVDEKILTRVEICSHLDYLINRSKNRKNFELAIGKWKVDRDHISNYVAGSRKVEIGKIIKITYK